MNSAAAMVQMPRRGSFSLTKAASIAFTALALLTLAALTLIFIVQSLPAWRHEGLAYITGAKWFYRAHTFGALPMIYGTFIVAFIALLLAAPIGVGAALFTAEFLPARPRLAIKIAVELLAGVPSVVYGLIGILLLRNCMKKIHGTAECLFAICGVHVELVLMWQTGRMVGSIK